MHQKAVEMIDGFDLKLSPLVNHWNPLMLAVALSEACEHFSSFLLL